jgi:hypothetical protein
LDVNKVVDGHMSSPLHCYSCAGEGQILEN